MQERLTKEIADAVWEAIAPAGVGVVIEATHMCMVSITTSLLDPYMSQNGSGSKSI